MRHTGRTFAWLILTLALAASAPPEAPVADAAQNGDLDSVRRLVEAGADVNTPHGDGMTALHWAAESGDTEIVEVLIYAGAHLEATTRNRNEFSRHIRNDPGLLVRGRE